MKILHWGGEITEDRSLLTLIKSFILILNHSFMNKASVIWLIVDSVTLFSTSLMLWILIMIIPTTGTHWCYEIVAMLRNNSPELTKQSPPLIDRLPVEKLRQVSDGLRVSHLLPRYMPRDSIERRCKIIHIYRNPGQKMLPSRILTSWRRPKKESS